MFLNVTGAYFALFIFDNGVDSNRIILYQLIAYRKNVEFLNAHGRPANAVIQHHIELQVLFLGSLIICVTFNVLKNVTMGFGACIHSSKAAALVVSQGEISCGIDVMIDWFNKDAGV